MKAKKSEKASLENKRGLYFQLGLIISLCLTLSAFEWSSNGNTERKIKGNLTEEPIYTVDFVVPKTPQQQKSSTVKNKAVKPTTKIKVVKKEPQKSITDSTLAINDIIGEDGDDKPVIETITYVDPNKAFKDYQVTKSPQFPGGESAITSYINNNIKIPQITIDRGVPVKMYLSFVVNYKGEVTNVKFENGEASPQLKKEAIRLLEAMPNWTPGEKDGNPVSVIRYIPISVLVK